MSIERQTLQISPKSRQHLEVPRTLIDQHSLSGDGTFRGQWYVNES